MERENPQKEYPAIFFESPVKIPQVNFYRRLKSVLNLSFIPSETEQFYCNKYQNCINPILFFKLSLVAYLENIKSDELLFDFCAQKFDILYFLDLNFDSNLPPFEMMETTRLLFPNCLYISIFEKILTQCSEKKLVSKHKSVIRYTFV